MKKLIIVMISLMLVIPIQAQRYVRLLESGDEYFHNEEYTEAVEIYNKVLKKDRPAEVRKEVSFKMGECYRKLLDYSEAWKWYNVALNAGFNDPVIYLYLSEVGLGLEDFDNAIYFSEKYLEAFPEDMLGKKIYESAVFSKENYFLKSLIEVNNEYGVNSGGQEWGVGFFENIDMFYPEQGKKSEQYDIEIHLKYNNIIYWALRSERLKERIVFASTKDESSGLDSRTGTGYSSIYQATYSRRLNKWDTPTLLHGGINSDKYEGFLSYDPENLTAYFMNCGGYQEPRKTCDIYRTDYDPSANRWSTPEILPFNSDDYNIGYPSISDDGHTLFFASDMPGGKGGYDLYKVVKDKESGSWGEPRNLGDEINTEFNDAYPYIAGDVLYFSSFGHPGFGGFDIFYSETDPEGNFTEPENMGSPINSSADDFSLIINDEYTRGYFTSNRPGGSGEDDIYSFRINPETFQLKGRVTDKRTNAPLAGIDIFVYGDDNLIHNFTTDTNGYYNGKLDPEVNYQIEIVNTDYYPFHESFSVKEKLIASRFLVIREFNKDIELLTVSPEFPEDGTKAENEKQTGLASHSREGLIETSSSKQNLGKDYKLPVILFDYGKENLSANGKLQADSVFSFLVNNPEESLIIHGHTDEVSSYLFNFYLSQKRTQTIINYLTGKGIDSKRLFGRGHGKMLPVVKEADSEQEHRKNRRVAFEVVTSGNLENYINMASKESFRYLNSLTRDAHYSQGIEFMVQFAATRNPVHPDYYRGIMKLLPEQDVIYYFDKDRLHRYSLGSFKDLKSSVEVHNKLREFGYDTYIVAFLNGERISVAEANRMLSNR